MGTVVGASPKFVFGSVVVANGWSTKHNYHMDIAGRGGNICRGLYQRSYLR